MLRRIIFGLVVVVIALIAYVLLWPVRVDPEAWNPPPAPALSGVYAPNNRLAAVERLAEGAGVGPETIAIDAQGNIYGGMVDGRIIRVRPDGSGVATFADTGGRPLGLDFDTRGNLIVADGRKGLLAITPDGKITVLATEHGGVKFGFTDDVDIGRDGTIYFSDASHKFDVAHYTQDLLEHRANGRLLAYDPTTRTTKLLLDGLYFANGVAVSPDQSFVLVNETSKYRVRRLWLSGPRAGQNEVFIENLPGFPDGISSNGAGVYWLALAAPRNPDLDAMLPKPFMRKVLARLPQRLAPQPKCHAFVLGLDTNGKVVQNLQDPECKHFGFVTAVTEHNGYLYLGSLLQTAIGRVALNESSGAIPQPAPAR
ncbi:MAG: SMP-30/gluconolactonase/LRE family protein [Sulfurifustis sp.]